MLFHDFIGLLDRRALGCGDRAGDHDVAEFRSRIVAIFELLACHNAQEAAALVGESGVRLGDFPDFNRLDL